MSQNEVPLGQAEKAVHTSCLRCEQKVMLLCFVARMTCYSRLP